MNDKIRLTDAEFTMLCDKAMQLLGSIEKLLDDCLVSHEIEAAKQNGDTNVS